MLGLVLQHRVVSGQVLLNCVKALMHVLTSVNSEPFFSLLIVNPHESLSAKGELFTQFTGQYVMHIRLVKEDL